MRPYIPLQKHSLKPVITNTPNHTRMREPVIASGVKKQVHEQKKKLGTCILKWEWTCVHKHNSRSVKVCAQVQKIPQLLQPCASSGSSIQTYASSGFSEKRMETYITMLLRLMCMKCSRETKDLLNQKTYKERDLRWAATQTRTILDGVAHQISSLLVDEQEPWQQLQVVGALLIRII